jgi:hypothetical protein
MSDSSETVLLIIAVILILAGLAGSTIKAFNIEVPAITGKYTRIGLFTIGVVFASIALWIILRPSLLPQSVPPLTGPTVAPGVETDADPALSSSQTLPLNPPGATAIPEAINTPTASSPETNRIGPNQTVTGTLYYNEGNSWVFSEGPATINIILDVGPYGEGLIIFFDPKGIQREYVDAQHGREERLVNYYVPDDGDYTIFVRNSNNTQVDYRLTLELVDSSIPSN